MNPESLKWRDWDMITGGLEAFIANEENWLEDSDRDIARGANEMIIKLETLSRKIEVIKRKLWIEEMGLKR
jgi:hypothetical protein